MEKDKLKEMLLCKVGTPTYLHFNFYHFLDPSLIKWYVTNDCLTLLLFTGDQVLGLLFAVKDRTLNHRIIGLYRHALLEPKAVGGFLLKKGQSGLLGLN